MVRSQLRNSALTKSTNGRQQRSRPRGSRASRRSRTSGGGPGRRGTGCPATGSRPSPSPDAGTWPVRSIRARACSCADRLGTPGRLDLPAVDDHVRAGHEHEVHERPATRTRGPPAGGTGPTWKPWAPSALQPSRPPVALFIAIQSFWSTKSATRWANTSHVRTRTESRHAALPEPVASPMPTARPVATVRRRRPGPRRTLREDRGQRPGEPREVADPRPVRDHGHGGPAHARVARRPRIGGARRGGSGARPRAAAASGPRAVRPAAARGPRGARPPRGRRSGRRGRRGARAPARSTRARRGRRGPVRSMAGPLPGSTSPATTAQRSSRASGRRAAQQDRAERVGARREQALELVALGERERREARLARVGRLELGAQRAQPRRSSRGRPRIDDVAEQDGPGERGSHPPEPTRWLSWPYSG